MNIYLDVNGVMLTRNYEEAPFLRDFLEYVLSKHDVYWLTTHCSGDTAHVIEFLSRNLSSDLMPLVQKIKPTTWQTLKTEGIDFTKDFRWFDDNPMDAEKKVLEKNNCLDKLIVVDLDKEPDILKKFIDNTFTT